MNNKVIVDPNDCYERYELACKGQLKKKALSTGFICLDENLLLSKGYLMILTGFPGSGKSEWLDAILLNMSIMYQWKVAYFSPENHPVEQHMLKLAEKFNKKQGVHFSKDEKVTAYNHICGFYHWLDPDHPTLDVMIDAAIAIKNKKGLDVLVVDPWNALDNERKQGAMLHENLGYQLSKLLKFGRDNDILVCVVAHPTKPQKDKDGNIGMPTLYDISDGAMWRNKADFGVVIHRPDMQKNQVLVSIQKIKQKHLGKLGMTYMDYDFASGRFKSPNDSDFFLPNELTPPF